MESPTEVEGTTESEERKGALARLQDEFEGVWNSLLSDLLRYSPDQQTQLKLVAVQAAGAPFFEAFGRPSRDEAPSNGFVHSHEREQGGAHVRRKQYGRHDKKSVPSGYVYEGGHLLTTRIDFSEPSPEVLLAARELLRNIGGMFVLKVDGEPPENLGIVIKKLMRRSEPQHDRVNAKAAWLQKTRDSLRKDNGRGRESWEYLLEEQLRMDAEHREAQEIRQERGEPDPPEDEIELLGELGERTKDLVGGSFDAPADGAAMLAYLRQCEVEIPDELTADVVDRMRQSVGLNKGGRRGKKTARSVVTEFAKRLESQRS